MQMQNFTAEELGRVISGKAELYEAAIRNGFYLPSLKSGIVTEVYITDVVQGKVFCPRFKDIRLLPCPRPPDKDTLIKHVKEIKIPNNLYFGITDQDHTPDKAWLLQVLSTYKPDLAIFKKDYVAPPRVVKAAAKPNINLPSDFLAGLPNSRKRTKAKRLSMISKGKTESRLERIKTLQEKFRKEAARLDNEIKQSKHKDQQRHQAHGSNTTWQQRSQHQASAS